MLWDTKFSASSAVVRDIIAFRFPFVTYRYTKEQSRAFETCIGDHGNEIFFSFFRSSYAYSHPSALEDSTNVGTHCFFMIIGHTSFPAARNRKPLVEDTSSSLWYVTSCVFYSLSVLLSGYFLFFSLECFQKPAEPIAINSISAKNISSFSEIHWTWLIEWTI